MSQNCPKRKLPRLPVASIFSGEEAVSFREGISKNHGYSIHPVHPLHPLHPPGTVQIGTSCFTSSINCCIFRTCKGHAIGGVLLATRLWLLRNLQEKIEKSHYNSKYPIRTGKKKKKHYWTLEMKHQNFLVVVFLTRDFMGSIINQGFFAHSSNGSSPCFC